MPTQHVVSLLVHYGILTALNLVVAHSSLHS